MAWTKDDQMRFEADSFERIAHNLGLIPNTPNYLLDLKPVNQMVDVVIDIIGPTCETCRGVKATDTTPGWVYKERDICECEE